jgi:hypothetical protein
MNIYKRTLASLALGLWMTTGFMAQANATTVDLTTDGLWHTFDVDALTASSGALNWIDLNDGSVLSFHIDNAAPLLLTVVDGGFSGDVFSVSDGVTLLGNTSAAVNSYPTSIGLDFDAALANPAYSKATYLLAPGSHMVTGWMSTSATADFGDIDATVGAVMLQAVPEPAHYAMLLAGLGLLSFAARRRSANRDTK